MKAERVTGERWRGKLQVPDWLLTSQVIYITSADWLFTYLTVVSSSVILAILAQSCIGIAGITVALTVARNTLTEPAHRGVLSGITFSTHLTGTGERGGRQAEGMAAIPDGLHYGAG